MATLATMAIKLEAMTDQANRQLDATASVVENVGHHCEVANQRTQMLQNTMGNTSKLQAFSNATQAVTTRVVAAGRFLSQFGQVVRSVAYDVSILTGQVLDLSTGLPMSRALAPVLQAIGGGLKAILMYALAIGVATVFVSFLKGISLQAAFAAVSVNRLTLAMSTLWFFLAKFLFIPIFAAFITGAEMANREIAKITGTLTPLQQAAQTVGEAFRRWSVLIGSDMLDGIATGLDYIGKSLIAVHALFSGANDMTGGWLITLLKVASVLMTIYAAWGLIRIAVTRVNIAISFLNSIGILKPVIAGMTNLIRVIWLAFTAQITLNGATLQGVMLGLRASLVAIAMKAYAAAIWLANAAQTALNALITYFMAITVVGLIAIAAATAAYVAYTNSATASLERQTNVVSALNNEYSTLAMNMKKVADQTTQTLADTESLMRSLQQDRNAMQSPMEKLQSSISQANSYGNIVETLQSQRENEINNVLHQLTAERERLQNIVPSGSGWDNTKRAFGFHEVSIKQINDDIEALDKQIAASNERIASFNSQLLTAENATAEEIAKIIEMHKDNAVQALGIAKYLEPTTMQKLDTDMISFSEALKANAITQSQYNQGMANLRQAIADEELRIKRQDESYQLLESVHKEMVTEFQKYNQTGRLAREAVRKYGMSAEQFAFVQQKAAKEFGSATGAARFFDSARLRMEKLEELNKAIDQYATMTRMTAEEIADAKKKAEQEIMQRTAQNKSGNGEVAALLRGTTAAYEAERRMLNDQQKQTQLLADVKKENEKSNTLAANSNTVLSNMNGTLTQIANNVSQQSNSRMYDA